MKRKILAVTLFSMGLLVTTGLNGNALEPDSNAPQTDQAKAPSEKPVANTEPSTPSEPAGAVKKEEAPAAKPAAAQEGATGAVESQSTSTLQVPAATDEADQPRDYIVIKHDTLWDISANLLKDPYKWPEIWKKNPQIKNPDLIHPGNKLRIWPDGRVELIGQKESLPAAAVEPAAVVVPADKQKPEDMPVVSLEPQEEKVVVLEPQEETAKSGADTALEQSQTAQEEQFFSARALERQGFISEKAMTETGAIAASRDGQHLMQSGDIVFISLKDSALKHNSFNIGDRYSIFKVAKKMVHPVTNKKLGNIIDIIGILEIRGTDGTLTGKIVKSYKEIPEGARIRPYVEGINKVQITQTNTAIDGVVIGSHEANEQISSADVVYVDQGVKSGIKQGNILNIYKKANKAVDPFKGNKISLPTVKVGRLIVAAVNEETSVCIVLHTTTGVNAGDIVRSEQTKK